MAIYVIGDLHLSFGVNKPMNIFGEKWENHAEKIKLNWLEKVKENDTVILPGDFSWATYLKDTDLDFEYINNLPGKKLLLKGNHDYWWTTLNKLRTFVEEEKFSNIDFIYNNEINNINVTPSFFNIISSFGKYLPSLKYVHLGGEKVTYRHIEKYNKVFLIVIYSF